MAVLTDVRIAQLLKSGEPVSFYDALMTVRAAQNEELSDRAVAAMVELHDAQMTTDGGRAILAEFLSAYAQRTATERDLAGRAITFEDSGKTARASRGATLQLTLTEQGGVGFRWEVASATHMKVTHRGRLADAPEPTALLEVVLNRVGRKRLELVERRPEAIDGMTDDDKKARSFVLRIVVESS